MGQAKQRGSREQRVAEALGLKERPLSEIKQGLGIADDAEFLGYAVHLEKSDEFLAEFTDSPEEGITRKAWAKTPELAQTYGTFIEAHDVSKQCRGSIVVGMFDTGNQIMVSTITGVRR
jgi:hypothetical protein